MSFTYLGSFQPVSPSCVCRPTVYPFPVSPADKNVRVEFLGTFCLAFGRADFIGRVVLRNLYSIFHNFALCPIPIKTRVRISPHLHVGPMVIWVFRWDFLFVSICFERIGNCRSIFKESVFRSSQMVITFILALWVSWFFTGWVVLCRSQTFWFCVMRLLDSFFWVGESLVGLACCAALSLDSLFQWLHSFQSSYTVIWSASFSCSNWNSTNLQGCHLCCTKCFSWVHCLCWW